MNLDIKISELLKKHDQSLDSHLGLANSLGDSFLILHNSIFRNIRSEFFRLGYSYTPDDFCDYAVLPFASLPQILKAKKVPYFNNVHALKKIETFHPNKFKCAEIIKVKSNYTLHESSHCIANEVMKQASISFNTLTGESEKAFRLVMMESFANTTETIGNLFNTSDEQSIFYELNSYVNMNKKSYSALKQTVELIGIKKTYALVYISYLFSNCLFNELPHKIYLQILDIVVDDDNLRKKARDSGAVKKLFNYAFELDLDFRIRTTGFYCQYMGIQTNIFKLFQFDLLQVIKNSNAIKSFIKNTDHLF